LETFIWRGKGEICLEEQRAIEYVLFQYLGDVTKGQKPKRKNFSGLPPIEKLRPVFYRKDLWLFGNSGGLYVAMIIQCIVR